MSALPERRQAVDIDEFERRLRAPDPAAVEKDPLAELARLVAGQGRADHDPLASIFGEAVPPRAPAVPPEASLFAPVVAPPPPVGQDPFGDFPDISPMLRKGEYPGEARDADLHAFRPPPPVAPAPPEFRPSSEFEDWAETAEIVPDAPPPATRSRKPLYVTAAVIVVGFVAIGASLAFRGGTPHATDAGVATIKAAAGPTKVQPQTSDSPDSAPRESTLLDRTAATPPVKKVVTRDEQPIDVNAAAKTPRVIPLAEGALSPATGGAASVSAPPPPLRGPQSASLFPEPKKVKTVAVRADGSIISSETAPAATAPLPPQRPAQPAPAAKNATPKTEVRAAGATPVAPAAKPPAAVKPPVAAKPPAAPKPKVVALAPQADVGDNADDAAEPAKPAASGGGYAVQLAAPGTEAEARQTAQRLGEKFSGALGGRRPSVQKASDKAVYRVRVTGLSKDGAASVCDSVKAAGGACFVTR